MAFELFNLPTRPGRLEAYLNVLALSDGRPDPIEVAALLMPTTPENERKLVQETHVAATELGLVTDSGRLAKGVSPDSLRGPEFADLLASRILTARTEKHSNFVFARVYAWLVLSCESSVRYRNGRWSNDEMAGDFNAQVYPTAGDRSFNSTKARAFVDWAVYLGLGWGGGDRFGTFHPNPTERLKRDLAGLFAADTELSAADFLSRVGDRYPFLDGGEIFRKLPGALPNEGQVTRVLSATVRQLHDEGVLELKVSRDAAAAIRLSTDPNHPIRSGFNGVIRGPRFGL